MFKTEEKKIGDCTYRVSQVGAIAGRAAFLKLVKAAGPLLGGMVDKKGKVSGDFDLGSMFEKVNLTESDLTYFCDLFSEKTFVVLPDGKTPRLDAPGFFDSHFAGRYLEMVQWLAFCVGVNFAGFFGGALSAPNDPASLNVPMPPVAS
jgi:hypothetical protein